jgi:hypothetical protein
MPEVVELRRMFGIPDYFIRVRVTDIELYERWLTSDIMGDVAIARMGRPVDALPVTHWASRSSSTV